MSFNSLSKHEVAMAVACLLEMAEAYAAAVAINHPALAVNDEVPAFLGELEERQDSIIVNVLLPYMNGGAFAAAVRVACERYNAEKSAYAAHFYKDEQAPWF